MAINIRGLWLIQCGVLSIDTQPTTLTHTCSVGLLSLLCGSHSNHSPVGNGKSARGEQCISSVPAYAYVNDFKNEYGACPSVFYECIHWTLMTSMLTVKYALCGTALSSFESLFVLFFRTDCRVKWLKFQKQKIYTPFSLYYPSTPPVIGAG